MMMGICFFPHVYRSDDGLGRDDDVAEFDYYRMYDAGDEYGNKGMGISMGVMHGGKHVMGSRMRMGRSMSRKKEACHDSKQHGRNHVTAWKHWARLNH
jgi:hypothetical protein